MIYTYGLQDELFRSPKYDHGRPYEPELDLLARLEIIQFLKLVCLREREREKEDLGRSQP